MLSLSIVIPVFNEEKRLPKTFRALNSLDLPKGIKLERVIFVNDGSTDKTYETLQLAPINFTKEIISYDKNMGKGYAVRQGMLASNSDYTLIFDADIATPLTELQKFVPLMLSGYDCIIGTRKNGHSTVTIHQPWIRENMGKVFTTLSRFVLQVHVTDFTCGFKAFKKTAKNKIFSHAGINRWGFDSEILFLAKNFGFTMIEKAVNWADQKDTKVNLLRDTVGSFFELLKVRFTRYHFS